MSMFTKRREDEQEIPRPGAAPARVAADPSLPRTTVAAPSPPQPVQAASPGSTTIGRTVSIKGDVHSEEDLLIDGKMEGRLDMGQNRLTVGPNGTVRAAIVAREVDLHGIINGNVEATERIILRKNAKMVGDLKLASVVIEDGAYFKGSIDITRPQGANPAPQAAAVKPPVP
jgi:cytoskeletal protein CcmA (bactofilin family)